VYRAPCINFRAREINRISRDNGRRKSLVVEEGELPQHSSVFLSLEEFKFKAPLYNLQFWDWRMGRTGEGL
jgi:hypothetical protein